MRISLIAVGKLLQTLRQSARVWLIKIGIMPPPDGMSLGETQLSGEQQDARKTLVIHTLKRPPRTPLS